MGSNFDAWMVPQHKQPCNAVEVNVVCNESEVYEAALIDAGFLMPVLVKHRNVLGEPSKLPAGNLPKVKTETEPGALVAQHPYQTALSKQKVIDREIDTMLGDGNRSSLSVSLS